jgi:hypothetical protein
MLNVKLCKKRDCKGRIGCEENGKLIVTCHDCQEKQCPVGVAECFCGYPKDFPSFAYVDRVRYV